MFLSNLRPTSEPLNFSASADVDKDQAAEEEGKAMAMDRISAAKLALDKAIFGTADPEDIAEGPDWLPKAVKESGFQNGSAPAESPVTSAAMQMLLANGNPDLNGNAGSLLDQRLLAMQRNLASAGPISPTSAAGSLLLRQFQQQQRQRGGSPGLQLPLPPGLSFGPHQGLDFQKMREDIAAEDKLGAEEGDNNDANADAKEAKAGELHT